MSAMTEFLIMARIGPLHSYNGSEYLSGPLVSEPLEPSPIAFDLRPCTKESVRRYGVLPQIKLNYLNWQSQRKTLTYISNNSNALTKDSAASRRYLVGHAAAIASQNSRSSHAF